MEDEVLAVVERVAGARRELRPRGALGYGRQWRVGPVTVLADGRGAFGAAMGCHVEVSGDGCDQLGHVGLVEIYQELELRASRVDVAVDGCPFTPHDIATAWRAGQVRTKVKVPKDARPDRQWRSGEWMSSATGDTAYLGSKRAARMARVYDRRESGTRFELQVRHKAAAAVAADLLDGEVGEGWSLRALGHVRAFVDFVDTTGANASRRPLLPFWSSFIGHVERSTVRLGGVAVDSFEAVAAWVERQVAPMLAVVERRLGPDHVRVLLSRGRSRWRPKHVRLALAVPLG